MSSKNLPWSSALHQIVIPSVFSDLFVGKVIGYLVKLPASHMCDPEIVNKRLTVSINDEHGVDRRMP